MEKLVENKEATAERLSSGDEQRPGMASIWLLMEPLLRTVEFKSVFNLN
jgi:hypothetical protein